MRMRVRNGAAHVHLNDHVRKAGLICYHSNSLKCKSYKMAAAPQANKYDYKVLRANYDILSTKASAGDSLIPDTAYADFLK